jgi:uncharacterized membrane protein
MTYFKAFTFDGKRSAHKAINKIEDKDLSYIWMEEGDYASISVNKKGHYRVHSTWAQDSSLVSGEAGLGAVLGGLIGLLFGPGGAIAGAAIGGGTGGLIGASENISFNDPVLDDFAASLVPDSSALIILGPADAIAEFTAELADYEVQTFEAELDEAALDALQAAMKN